MTGPAKPATSIRIYPDAYPPSRKSEFVIGTSLVTISMIYPVDKPVRSI